MNDAGNNVNYGFFAPYKVQINRMVFQFDGDTNNGNTFQCDLSDTDSFIGNTSSTGVPAGSDDRVLAILTGGGL